MGGNLLHTNSYNYGDQIDLPNLISKRQGTNMKQASYLREKELSVYKSFFPDCTGFEDFLNRLRELLKSNSADREAFKAFQNPQIINYLEKIYNKLQASVVTDEDVNIKFELDTSNLNKSSNEIIQALSNLHSENESIIVSAEKNNVKIEIKPGLNRNATVAILKDVINKVYNKRYHGNEWAKKQSSKKGEAIEASYSDSSLKSFLKSEIQHSLNGNTVGSIIDFTSNVNSMFISSDNLASSPYSNKLKDIRSMSQKGKAAELGKQAQQIKQDIKNMCNYSNTSPEMQKAIDITWNNLIGGKLDNLNFFMKGGNLSYLSGAFGEFQTALLANYIQLKANTSNKFLASLISDTLKKGEQSKVDVTILQNIGIQVKNYNPYASAEKLQILNTNIHPIDLMAYSEFASMDFLDFIANYYFNTTYGSSNSDYFSRLQETLSSYFAEIANMAVEDSVSEKVTFYFISGNYLVPGSYLIEAANNNDIGQLPVEITSSFDGNSDEAYEMKPKGGDAPFVTYWKPQEGENHNFVSTKENYSLYNSLVSKDISIRSGFNYRTVLSAIGKMGLSNGTSIF